MNGGARVKERNLSNLYGLLSLFDDDEGEHEEEGFNLTTFSSPSANKASKAVSIGTVNGECKSINKLLEDIRELNGQGTTSTNPNINKLIQLQQITIQSLLEEVNMWRQKARKPCYTSAISPDLTNNSQPDDESSTQENGSSTSYTTHKEVNIMAGAFGTILCLNTVLSEIIREALSKHSIKLNIIGPSLSLTSEFVILFHLRKIRVDPDYLDYMIRPYKGKFIILVFMHVVHDSYTQVKSESYVVDGVKEFVSEVVDMVFEGEELYINEQNRNAINTIVDKISELQE